mmetsp:Transcript_75794/g.218860  ORF Transcript_75794/g.218860 Transcript_75794/m.218860 type:complete len:217 (+) Transcript_75794:1871-2521(+)
MAAMLGRDARSTCKPSSSAFVLVRPLDESSAADSSKSTCALSSSTCSASERVQAACIWSPCFLPSQQTAPSFKAGLPPPTGKYSDNGAGAPATDTGDAPASPRASGPKSTNACCTSFLKSSKSRRNASRRKPPSCCCMCSCCNCCSCDCKRSRLTPGDGGARSWASSRNLGGFDDGPSSSHATLKRPSGTDSTLGAIPAAEDGRPLGRHAPPAAQA